MKYFWIFGIQTLFPDLRHFIARRDRSLYILPILPEDLPMQGYLNLVIHGYPSRTPIHFLQESVRFHFQDLGRQCIILAGILEDLGR